MSKQFAPNTSTTDTSEPVSLDEQTADEQIAVPDEQHPAVMSQEDDYLDVMPGEVTDIDNKIFTFWSCPETQQRVRELQQGLAQEPTDAEPEPPVDEPVEEPTDGQPQYPQ